MNQKSKATSTMKLSALPKIAGASILALSLATLPASAQTTTNPNGAGTDSTTTTGTDNTTTTSTDNTRTQDDGFDWGWLGLIGLAGLAGLAGKKRQEPTAYREPDRATTTTYRD